MLTVRKKIWLARLIIGLVFFFNLQCAVVFLAFPQRYLASFELSGPPGEGMLRGLGLLFIMWNVPYAVALWNPVRQRTSLYQAVAMQFIGLVGESFLLATFPGGHPAIAESVGRFILFDAVGLALLVIAAFLSGWGKDYA